jgi:hypothetical protein
MRHAWWQFAIAALRKESKHKKTRTKQGTYSNASLKHLPSTTSDGLTLDNALEARASWADDPEVLVCLISEERTPANVSAAKVSADVAARVGVCRRELFVPPIARKTGLNADPPLPDTCSNRNSSHNVVKCDGVCFTQISEEQNQNMQTTAHRFLTSFDGILGLVVDATSNETKDTASLSAET